MTNILASVEIPTPETLKAYEALGTVGILLGIIIVGFGSLCVCAAWVAWFASRFVVRFATSHLTQMEKQSELLARMEIKQEGLASMQQSWHQRLDVLLRCYSPHCPLKMQFQEPKEPQHEPIPK